ncbi:SixA phosphatase family protein [Gluconobacter kanchanaburiensis]|uniref:Phosphohistidine phosphatase n=1 Tax=Gluconobacter kanchanaburiensis NBRC 103587 TaxID=1307948 RepID=A0A511B6P4_9PROT|nr:histidine phosphatase family protein [Gluconobacter kanchanaburiensis]MBF0860611.1 phosphohistidine phosphatase [Gluconobacter kanchanaburiensis]GEK96130.1 phosphohistidine phosphatase [Gluconobacter kanchanaburiensis NBRC 103587]
MSSGQLLLLRHAQAATYGPQEQGDRGRPLTALGLQQASLIGQQIARLDLPRPFQVLCSPALRTRQTTRNILTSLSDRPSVMIEDSLYSATPDDLYNLIHGTPDTIRTLMIVGHNPALGNLIHDLLGAARTETRFSALANGYPIAALTIFDIAREWMDARPSTIRPARVLLP